MNDSVVEARFESLGDNCEFGFVQRRAGVEAGGLLRWAVSPTDDVTRALQNRFAGLYAIENLESAGPGMVRDRASGLSFHSALSLPDGTLVPQPDQRHAIWIEEAAKIGYLAQKLLEVIQTGSRFLVCKTNVGASADQIEAMRGAIAAIGPAKLLFVVEDPQHVGEVMQKHDNLYLGHIDRFAPYHLADDASYEVWRTILTTMAKRAAE